MNNMIRQILALLLLLAGWGVLVADSPGPPNDDGWSTEKAGYDVFYDFQTDCLGEAIHGQIHLWDETESDEVFSWDLIEDEHYRFSKTISKEQLDLIQNEGLSFISGKIIYITQGISTKERKISIPIGFDFEIEGMPLGASNDSEDASSVFFCQDALIPMLLASDKTYHCENSNSSLTCTLNLKFISHE